MLKVRIILFIIFLLLNHSSAISQQNKNDKNILALFAMQPNTPAYHHILFGIQEKLRENFGDSYNLYTEYLEKGLYPEGEYPKEKFNLINEKYDDSELDLIICVGINIIEIIKKNAADYLLQLPVVSMDLDFSAYGFSTPFSLNERTAEIHLKLNVEKTITEALSLFPKTESVYFISGVAPLDQLLLSISKQAAERTIQNKNVNFITNVSMEETIKLVYNLPKYSIIFIPGFNTDTKNVPYFNPEAVRIISRNAKAPVFIYTSTGFGDGAIGGYILNFEKAGLISGEAVVKILNGLDPTSINAKEKDYYEFIYDWRALNRWNLANSDLIPKGSIILFKEVNLLDKYKWIIGAVLLFFVLMSMLIANLIRLNRNQKLMTKKLRETENKYRNFLHEDRILRLGQLTASLSHELNQPLTAIQYSAQAGIRFLKSGALDPMQAEEILGNIIEDNKRAAGIISSIRSMMKIETREMENVNLNSLIEETINIFNAEALYKQIQLKRELQDDPVYVLGDKIQLQQVILNFMSNAVAAMEKTDPENKILEIIQLAENGSVTISVRDSGSGIDKTIKEKIFQPFVTSKESGFGIGLAISKSIIEKHNGEIWADNIKDGGAEFSFKLKVIKDEL